MTKLFEKGDIVKIAKTSMYYSDFASDESQNPLCEGRVINQGQQPTPTVSVRWNNGEVNHYGICDLEYATPEEQLEENPIRYTVLDLDGNPITFDTKEEAKAFQYKISKPHIEPSALYKQVDFMGITLTVLESHKWIAIDNDGSVFSFESKPSYSRNEGIWCSERISDEHQRIGTLKCAPKNFDYNNSLTEI